MATMPQGGSVPPPCKRGILGGHIPNNGIVIHHLIMIWQMLAPSPSSASSSLSILRSAKLSRTPPVGLIRAVCLCEAAGALGAAGARHCQWTERLTLPGSRTETRNPRFPCYCFHLNPLSPAPAYFPLSECVSFSSFLLHLSLLAPVCRPVYLLIPVCRSLFLSFPSTHPQTWQRERDSSSSSIRRKNHTKK